MADPTPIPTPLSQHDIENRYKSSGISVLIVGAGVGGLMAALECSRKGHEVRVIEKTLTPDIAGDGFTIGISAIRSFRNWPAMQAENEKISWDPWLSMHKMTGECISGPRQIEFQAPPEGVSEDIPRGIYRHSRPKFHAMLLSQLRSIDVHVQYGKRAVKYYEETATGKAGVILQNGEKLEADVVVAADGIGSHSTEVTMGSEVPARATGYAIYRAAFPIDAAMVDPMVRERFPVPEDGRTYAEMWTGDGSHAYIGKKQDEIAWALTYKDSGKAAESWSHQADPKEVLEVTSTVEGWPEVADRLIKLTPKDRLLHFKLMWRNPQPCWTSPGGRIVQLGDAAHTFLPSAGNGATQAIEDAISLATCLQLAGGKGGVPWATKVHNLLRFERVSCLQKLGVISQESRHRSEPDTHVGNTQPQVLRYFFSTWIWRHDPESYAEANYEKALSHLQFGTPFQNTNTPTGHIYKPWTIDELLDIKESGGQVELDGEWE